MTNSDIQRRAADPLQRVALLRELTTTDPREARELARRFVDDEDHETRISALTCIGTLGDDASQPLVRRALADVEPLVRIAAIEALVELGSLDEQTLEALQSLVSDEKESVRAYAGWALGRVGNVALAARLQTFLRDEPSAVARAGILEGLYRLTKQEPYLHTLETLLGSSDPEARAFASNSLVGVASRDNVRRLIERLDAAAKAESYPAIRDVLEGNLRTLREMDDQDDFDVG
jgi:HEAT repeat protein